MKGNDYYADYEIYSSEENQDIVGNKLMIEVSKDSFYKEVQVFGSYDNKIWENIKTDIIYHIKGQNKDEIALDAS